MRTQSFRDTKHMVTPINGEFRSMEEMGMKPHNAGSVNFHSQVARKPLH
jgi:hypothetical protein